MKSYSFFIRLRYSMTLDAENETDARNIIKDIFMQDHNIELTDDEIKDTLDENNLLSIIYELRDELREYGKDEDALKQIFDYYGRPELLDDMTEGYDDENNN